MKGPGLSSSVHSTVNAGNSRDCSGFSSQEIEISRISKCCLFIRHEPENAGYFNVNVKISDIFEQIKAVTSCSTHKIDQQETNG